MDIAGLICGIGGSVFTSKDVAAQASSMVLRSLNVLSISCSVYDVYQIITNINDDDVEYGVNEEGNPIYVNKYQAAQNDFQKMMGD